MDEGKEKVVQNNETNADQIGAAVLTYLRGLLVATIIGATVGFGAAWFSIWMESVSMYLVGLVCIAIPAGVARVTMGRRNIMTALICASGAFVSIGVMFLTIDSQGLTWSDNESIWDHFWIYAFAAIAMSAFCGFVKDKD